MQYGCFGTRELSGCNKGGHAGAIVMDLSWICHTSAQCSMSRRLVYVPFASLSSLANEGRRIRHSKEPPPTTKDDEGVTGTGRSALPLALRRRSFSASLVSSFRHGLHFLLPLGSRLERPFSAKMCAYITRHASRASAALLSFFHVLRDDDE